MFDCCHFSSIGQVLYSYMSELKMWSYFRFFRYFHLFFLLCDFVMLAKFGRELYLTLTLLRLIIWEIYVNLKIAYPPIVDIFYQFSANVGTIWCIESFYFSFSVDVWCFGNIVLLKFSNCLIRLNHTRLPQGNFYYAWQGSTNACSPNEYCWTKEISL